MVISKAVTQQATKGHRQHNSQQGRKEQGSKTDTNKDSKEGNQHSKQVM
ncbi:hypothetical protein [Prevotella melaninogenica]|nr:hypothetical protein [Prevotella melaninogenica]